MPTLTREEKNLKLVLVVSTIVYLVGGFAFVLFPELILRGINACSRVLTPSLTLVPISPNKVWVCLAFALMMTITSLSYLGQRNVRRGGGYVIALLVSKISASLAAISYFLFTPQHYLAYLVIFMLDGSIFWVTLYYLVKAHRAFFKTQTDFLRQTPVAPKTFGPTKVVALTGEDKFEVLDRVLAQTGFFDILEKHFQESGKIREAFSVVVKPNFMYMHSKKDSSSFTDPELVEALIDRIVARGFSNVAMVESQSTYGNYYNNREVAKVAAYINYTAKNYRIVDLTAEMVAFDYGGRLGMHFVGPTWRDADFRISFAKNKTHVFCHYTLTLKNIYGTLPMQNKLKEYHTKREYDWPTIETLKHFPVQFGLIDAFISADGPFGVIVCEDPKPTKTIIGGESLLAVDWVGAKKMGLNPDDPKVGRFLPLAVEAFGKPEIIWEGDQSVYEPWENVNEALVASLDLIEEAYAFSNWWFASLTAMDEYFSLKKMAWPILLMRKILAPFKRLYYLYDYLGV
jgi:uncharacterized protein (DUF362 family)